MPAEREWVSFRDPDDDSVRFTFDVSFLLSSYTCIYGAGCKGVDTDAGRDDVGCCAHGAYLSDDEDRENLAANVELLDADLMQNFALLEEGFEEQDDEGEFKTATVDDACIFLNRAGGDHRVGCAFHHLAMDRGEHHMTYKPWVCWQLPLHREIDEVVGNDGKPMEVHTISAYERGTWGEGGADFAWWCTEDPDAFTGAAPVYRSMEHELRTMIGDRLYVELAEYLQGRARSRRRVAFLPIA